MLRAFRFAAKIGGSIEEKSLGAIIENRNLFLTIPPERIRLEIIKALKYKYLILFFKGLYSCDLLKYIFPSLDMCSDIGGGERHGEMVMDHCLKAMDSVNNKYILIRLAALLHDVGKAQTARIGEDGITHFYGHEHIGADIVNRELYNLRFPLDDIQFICELIENHMFYFEDITKDSTYKRFMNKLEYCNIRDLIRLRIADRSGNLAKANLPKITHKLKETIRRIRKIEQSEDCMKLSDLAINGRDLIALGFVPGPTFKVVLNHCLELVIENPEMNKKDILISESLKLLETGDK